LSSDLRPAMFGGGFGGYEPGEWSDDTQMALCIVRAVAHAGNLTDAQVLDQVADGFLGWLQDGPADVGILTRTVLHDAEREVGFPADRCQKAAVAYLRAHPRGAAGNGALMRTGVVGLLHLRDREATAEAARAVATLTHADRLCGESCVLWTEAVRVAVLDGRLELRAGLDLLPKARQARWRAAIDEAESHPAGHFTGNGFTVTALQAAWAAIRETASASGEAHVRAALETAVRIGDDTDTVAAIAGALVGARWGASYVPAQWREAAHGWPGLRADDLERLARETALAGEPAPAGRHPDPLARGVTSISLRRTGCYGTCPVYSVELRSDGTADYLGEMFVEWQGLRLGRIGREEFERLASVIVRLGFFEMRARYTTSVTDAGTDITTVVRDGVTKSVSDYADSGPGELWAIAELIDSTVAEVEWEDPGYSERDGGQPDEKRRKEQ